MAVKDTVIGTTKRLVAEIVGDGALADEGSRQTSGAAPTFPPNDRSTSVIGRDAPGTEIGRSYAPATTEHDRFALLVGNAALSVWPNLPRDAQEQLFAAAADGGVVANALAVFLHERHPKTARPAAPTHTD